jgi:heterotetrameric sarcosine oxidase gamma subunit
MIRKGRSIVTDAATVTVRRLEPDSLIAVDLWSETAAARARLAAILGGELPGLTRSSALAGGWRAIRVEPTVWWLSGPLAEAEAMLAQLEGALGEDGAAAELSGAFTRLAVQGRGWRELLMFGGVFDAEDRAFGPGVTAGTLLHHVSVRYDVVDEDRAHIHVAPSYAADLLHHLETAAARL